MCYIFDVFGRKLIVCLLSNPLVSDHSTFAEIVGLDGAQSAAQLEPF